MIRLLMGVTLSEMGGTQRVVYNIIANLPEDLYHVTLVTSPGGELLDWIDALNAGRTNKVEVIAAGCLKRQISPLHDAKAFILMLRIARSAPYDIAHFHNSKMGTIGRFTARLAGIPKIYYTVHGWGLNPTSTGKLFGVMSFLEKAIARFTTEVVFVSESDRRTGIGNGWAREEASSLIYNGIDREESGPSALRGELGIAPGIPVIAFVARLAQPKDPLFAIRVSGYLGSMGLDHRLLIIGDGPLAGECMDLAAEINVEGQVLFLGRRSDVRVILQQVDIFCLFTKWEGLPISIIEAMFAGLPVVASSVGGVPELVEHGKTGYLLEDFDVSRAADRLAALMGDRDLRLTMGACGKAAARQHFTVGGMVEGYRRLYET